jgi:hypothetical protein
MTARKTAPKDDQRVFDTGAMRNSGAGKLNFTQCFDPRVVADYAKYIRESNEGKRDDDNWKLGIPDDAAMASLLRHVMDLWQIIEGTYPERPEDGHIPTVEEACGGIWFNTQVIWRNWLDS